MPFKNMVAGHGAQKKVVIFKTCDNISFMAYAWKKISMEGCPRVWIHGEKELESEIRRRREGIPANDKTLAELRRIASDLGLGAPW